MSGAPLRFKGQGIVNIIIALSIIVLLSLFILQQSLNLFMAMAVCSFLIGVLLIVPIGGADMPVVIFNAQLVFRMGSSRYWLTLSNHYWSLQGL